ncbi:Integrase [Acididesulfobacillus acetoxydans]|uniref:Integrase n=1 Tax=Acididesulfobacillus acetoxydans TaxID=1561005 RepID=A0A8S0WAH3_9FIRM|nr:tyrosine-type recombinase/integrase [Acididesulfobacillus acetoxydans]CAA7603449.1 Integrase [Acididesulfobacillus acetoxydans]CEJ07681.1 Phage integrase, N-terminal SAM-like domain [Acididesulfobacillus acetoxydans]
MLNYEIIDWLTYLRQKNRSENTVCTYRQRLLRFAEWFDSTNGEPLTPERVTPTDLRDYKAYLVTAKKRTPATVNLSFAAIASWLEYHKQNVDMPRLMEEVRSAPQGLDKQEQHALMRAVEREGSIRDIALITLMMHSGLRISEVAALDIEDLTLNERSGSVIVREGKGGKYRMVPLDSDTRKALKNYLNDRGAGSVFLSQRGRGTQRLTASGIRQVIDQYAYLAKLPQLHPHALRHTFAKNMLNAGEGLEMVAEFLGHKRLDTTRIYYGKRNIMESKLANPRI